MEITRNTGLLLDNLKCHRWQFELTCGSLFTAFNAYRPFSILDVIPHHGRILVASLGGQKRYFKERAECLVGIRARLPQRPNFVIGQDARTSDRLIAPHALDDRARIVLISALMPT